MSDFPDTPVAGALVGLFVALLGGRVVQVLTGRVFRPRVSDAVAGALGGWAGCMVLGAVAESGLKALGATLLASVAGAASAVGLWRVALGRMIRWRMSVQSLEPPVERIPSPLQLSIFRKLSVVAVPAACALHLWGYIRFGKPDWHWQFYATLAMFALYWAFAPSAVDSSSSQALGKRWFWIEGALKYYAQGCVYLALAAWAGILWFIAGENNLPVRWNDLASQVTAQLFTALLIREWFKGLVWTKNEWLSRKEKCRPALEAEVARWLAMPWEQIVAELAEVKAYETTVDGRTYQIEVELLENTDAYVHVIVCADDGTFPSGYSPLSASFVLDKRSTPQPPR